MLLLAWLAACCLPMPGEKGEPGSEPETEAGAEAPPVPIPGPSATPSTPDASDAARPGWAQHQGYAPQAKVGALGTPTAVEGAVTGGLLMCTLRSSLREVRFRQSAQLPDLEARLGFGAHSQYAVGGDDDDTLVITAPLAALEPGNILRIEAYDRQLLRVRKLGVTETGYTALPAVMQSPGTDDGGLEASCVYVARETVEIALVAPLTSARASVARWKPSVRLEDSELCLSGEAAEASAALHDAAGLVGWSDPRVAAVVAVMDRKVDAHHGLLAQALGTRRGELAGGRVEVAPGASWSGGTLIQGQARVAEAVGGASLAEWALLLPVEIGPGSTAWPFDDFELVDSAGAHWHLSLAALEGAVDQADPRELKGRGTVVLTPTGGGIHGDAAVKLPGLLRARVGGSYAFQRVD